MADKTSAREPPLKRFCPADAAASQRTPDEETENEMEVVQFGFQAAKSGHAKKKDVLLVVLEDIFGSDGIPLIVNIRPNYTAVHPLPSLEKHYCFPFLTGEQVLIDYAVRPGERKMVLGTIRYIVPSHEREPARKWLHTELAAAMAVRANTSVGNGHVASVSGNAMREFPAVDDAVSTAPEPVLQPESRALVSATAPRHDAAKTSETKPNEVASSFLQQSSPAPYHTSNQTVTVVVKQEGNVVEFSSAQSRGTHGSSGNSSTGSQLGIAPYRFPFEIGGKGKTLLMPETSGIYIATESRNNLNRNADTAMKFVEAVLVELLDLKGEGLQEVRRKVAKQGGGFTITRVTSVGFLNALKAFVKDKFKKEEVDGRHVTQYANACLGRFTQIKGEY